MEGNALDLFRALAGVFAWGLPAALVLALLIFIVAVPALTVTGAVLHLHRLLTGKPHRVVPKDPQIAALERLWR